MAREQDGKFISSDGSVWNDQGSAGNADRAHAARNTGNSSEALIDGAGSVISGIGGAIGGYLAARHDRKYAEFQRQQYLKKGGAEYEEAKELESRGEYDAAIELYKAAVRKGVSHALYNIALCYRDGKKNDMQAFNYFKQAADSDIGRSAYDTALCYRDGIGTTKDDAQAFTYFKKAAERSDVEAYLYTAVGYRDGIGDEKNIGMAVKYFNELLTYLNNLELRDLKMVTDSWGYTIGDVLNHLAVCYRDGGPGFEPNRGKAIKYFRDAATQGNAEARTYLEQMGVKFSLAGEVVNKFSSFLYAIPCAFGVTLVVNRLYVKITGADKLPTLAALLLIAVLGIVAFKVSRARNKITLALLALAAFGWLCLFGIIP